MQRPRTDWDADQSRRRCRQCAARPGAPSGEAGYPAEDHVGPQPSAVLAQRPVVLSVATSSGSSVQAAPAPRSRPPGPAHQPSPELLLRSSDGAMGGHQSNGSPLPVSASPSSRCRVRAVRTPQGKKTWATRSPAKTVVGEDASRGAARRDFDSTGQARVGDPHRLLSLSGYWRGKIGFVRLVGVGRGCAVDLASFGVSDGHVVDAGESHDFLGGPAHEIPSVAPVR